MKRNKSDHESYIEHINELVTNDKRTVVGVSTTKYDDDEDISSITIKLAPSGAYESEADSDES